MNNKLNTFLPTITDQKLVRKHVHTARATENILDRKSRAHDINTPSSFQVGEVEKVKEDIQSQLQKKIGMFRNMKVSKTK